MTLDQILSQSVLPPLTGIEHDAEKMVLLVHRGINWDVWGGQRRTKYWDALTDRVRAATYAGPTLSQWWQNICNQMDSQPKYATDRQETALLLASQTQKETLEILRKHAATIVLRIRVWSETRPKNNYEETSDG